jgi:hypothetical protein
MRIAIMTPTRGNVHYEYALSLANTWRSLPQWKMQWFTALGNAPLPDVRSMCLAQALAWGADKYVFIDDDISWKPEDFVFLVTQPVKACTGYYVMRGNEPLKTITIKFLDDNRQTDNRGLIEVAGAGFGFIRFDHEVFDAVKGESCPMFAKELPPHVNEHYRDWFPYGLVPSEVEGRASRAGEDMWFCQRMRDRGIPLYLDPRIQLGHNTGAEKLHVDILKAAA